MMPILWTIFLLFFGPIPHVAAEQGECSETILLDYKTLKKRERNTADKIVALTFDDGPHAKVTPKILKTLKQHKIKATFFLVGSHLNQHKRMLSNILEDGHEIGNHSYTHPRLTKKSKKALKNEIEKTKGLFENLETSSKWFRPPYGDVNRGVACAAHQQGLKTILWSVDANDWKKTQTPEKITRSVLQHTQSGSVILLHDSKRITAKALPQLIKKLKEKGYTFVTLSEWYKMTTPPSRLQESEKELKKIPVVNPTQKIDLTGLRAKIQEDPRIPAK